jgi:MFS family permease
MGDTILRIMKRPSGVSILYLFGFLKSLQFFGALSVPYFLYRIGLGYGQMFLLEALFSGAMMALEIPTGVVADRWGRKASLFWGSILMGLGFLAFGFVRSLGFLAAAEIICALGMTLVSGADSALLHETAKAERGGDARSDNARGEAADEAKAFSRYHAACTAGLFVSFPLGSLFAGSGIMDYRRALGFVFVLTALSFGLAAAAILGLRETSRSSARKGFIRHGIEGCRIVIKTPKLRNFGLNYAVISALTFFMFWFYQSLLGRENVPVSWYGFVGAGYNLGAAILIAVAPKIRKTLGENRALFVSSLLPGFLFLAAGLFRGMGVALVAIFGVTMMKLFRAPLLAASMNSLMDDEHRATALSGISMAERVLIALLYPIVGAAADWSLDASLIGLGILTIAMSFAVRQKNEDAGLG